MLVIFKSVDTGSTFFGLGSDDELLDCSLCIFWCNRSADFKLNPRPQSSHLCGFLLAWDSMWSRKWALPEMWIPHFVHSCMPLWEFVTWFKISFLMISWLVLSERSDENTNFKFSDFPCMLKFASVSLVLVCTDAGRPRGWPFFVFFFNFKSLFVSLSQGNRWIGIEKWASSMCCIIFSAVKNSAAQWKHRNTYFPDSARRISPHLDIGLNVCKLVDTLPDMIFTITEFRCTSKFCKYFIYWINIYRFIKVLRTRPKRCGNLFTFIIV